MKSLKGRRTLNKERHALEGNKIPGKIRVGYWNNKLSQGQRASTTRDKVGIVIENRKLDILCL